jgi:glycosyltransferase involved in cell wall biosynthesis
MGGSGVQRPAKMVKYWARMGWKITVITADPAVTLRTDPSLLEDVTHPNVTIHRIVDGLRAKAGTQLDLTNWSEKWLRPIRNWVNPWFIPDNKKGWAKKVPWYVEQLDDADSFDVILVTAPPYSAVLSAVSLKERLQRPLVIDFRDDWLENPLHRYPTRWHRRKHQQLEEQSLAAADAVWVVNDCIKKAFARRYPQWEERMSVTPQGYDPEDLPDPKESIQNLTPNKSTAPLQLLYSGLFYGERQPDVLLQALAALVEEDPSWKKRFLLEFQGGLDPHHRRMIADLGLGNICTDYGYVSHEDAVHNAAQADILWLIIRHARSHDCVTTGKLYEYMGLRKPILALTEAEAPLQLLKQYQSFWAADPGRVEAVAERLRQIWTDYQDEAILAPDEKFVASFDRKQIAQASSESLHKICTIAHA